MTHFWSYNVEVLLIVLLFLCLPVSAEPLFAGDSLENFKIISAEKLNYKDGDSVLLGDVKIQIGDYLISSPKAFVDSAEDGSPARARFINGAMLESSELELNAKTIEFDLIESILESYAEEGADVQLKIKGKESDIFISSDYTEFDLNQGFGLARRDGAKVNFRSDDLFVDSNSIEIQTKEGELDYIDFIGDVVALGEKERIESQELFYFPDTNLIKANTEVRIVYVQDEKPVYVFSDLAIYEREKNLFSVFTKSLNAEAEVHGDDIYGKARQIVLSFDDEKELDDLVFTGDAYAQYQTKSVLGYEVIFDAKTKELKTIVGRPKTQILKDAA